MVEAYRRSVGSVGSFDEESNLVQRGGQYARHHKDDASMENERQSSNERGVQPRNGLVDNLNAYVYL